MEEEYYIKENIDLSILEKYGYEKNEIRSYYEKYIDNNWWNYLTIDCETRIITNYVEEIGYWVFKAPYEEDIQDLINANLIEKVIDID